MKLKDLVKEDISCFFEIDGVKHLWTGISLYSYDKFYKSCYLERNLIGITYYEENREKEVNIIEKFKLKLN